MVGYISPRKCPNCNKGIIKPTSLDKDDNLNFKCNFCSYGITVKNCTADMYEVCPLWDSNKGCTISKASDCLYEFPNCEL
jgi:hypothetical protein